MSRERELGPLSDLGKGTRCSVDKEKDYARAYKSKCCGVEVKIGIDK